MKKAKDYQPAQKAVLELLQQRAMGYQRAMKQKDILGVLRAKYPNMDLPQDTAFRDMIDDLRQQVQSGQLQADLLVLASASKGYYLPVTEEDFEPYLREMQARLSTTRLSLQLGQNSLAKFTQHKNNLKNGQTSLF